MAEGLFYLGLAVWIVVYAIRRKQWSWPAFGWVMLVVVVVGGAGISVGLALTEVVGRTNEALGIAVYLGVLVVTVLLITIAAIKIERYYAKPLP